MAPSTIPALQSTTLTAPDGGQTQLWHAPGAEGGWPVILVPGMFDTRRVFVGVGGGLIGALLARGLDPWVMERRTAGPTGGRPGLDEVLEHDLPLVQQTVFAATGLRAAWAGHSYGGVLIARGMTTTLNPSLVWAAALYASAVDPPLLTSLGPRLGIRLITLGGTMPSKAMRIGPANESRAFMLDSLAWARKFRRGDRSSWSWAEVNVPLIGVVGTRDRVTPYRYCRRLFDAIGADPGQLHRVGAVSDVRRRVGHESVLVHEDVTHDTAPLVADWLSDVVPPTAPA